MQDKDQSARIHLASQDPAFPAQREAAYQSIVAALDALLIPRGYTLKGSTWTKASTHGKSALHLQRSRYGWDVQIALRFLTPAGTPPDGWPEHEDLPLDRFFPPGTAAPGTLAYLDVIEHPERLAQTLTALSENALPWLDANHADSAPPKAINLAEKLSLFTDHWSPKVIAAFNGHDVMLVKVQGEFVWHSHPDTDDFFLVLKGQVTIRQRDGDIVLNAGDLHIVPKGVEHCPVAANEAHILLIEPKGTPNTGDPATAAVNRPI